MSAGLYIVAASCITATAQYVSIKYTERLAQAGVEPSVGSVGDSYDNAFAETINGLYKAEVIHRRGPWRNFEAVEFATLEWVDWFKPCLSG
jgi:putative transposase